MSTTLCSWAKPSPLASWPTRRRGTTNCFRVLPSTSSTERRSRSRPRILERWVVKQLVPPLKQRRRQLQPSPQKHLKEDSNELAQQMVCRIGCLGHDSSPDVGFAGKGNGAG